MPSTIEFDKQSMISTVAIDKQSMPSNYKSITSRFQSTAAMFHLSDGILTSTYKRILLISLKFHEYINKTRQNIMSYLPMANPLNTAKKKSHQE